MNSSMRTRSIVAALVALVVAAIIPITPAAAAPSGEPEATQADAPSGLVLRRDPGAATAFVADASPAATPTAGGSDGFDWSAAALGAGAAFLALGAGAIIVTRRRTVTRARTGMSPSASIS
jgi:hypothetical protein